MSIPSFKQSFAFFAPLEQKSTTFTVLGREDNAHLARFILKTLYVLRKHAIILDTSVFYGTNIASLTAGLDNDYLDATGLLTPGDAALEVALADVITQEAPDVLIIDDLNALYQLFARDQDARGMRRLFIFMNLLSFSARQRGVSILSTAYGRRHTGAGQGHATRSLTATADLQVLVEDHHPTSLVFRCEKGDGWPGEIFEVSL